MVNGLSKSNEVIQNSPSEEKFKISELKERFFINVTEEEIKKYGDFLLSMEEINSIKQGINTVSKLGLEKLRLSIDPTKQTLDKYKKNISPLEELERKDGTVEETGNKLMEAFDKAPEKAKGKLNQVKEKAKDITEYGYKTQLGLAFKDAVTKLKNFDIWGAIKSIFSGLFGAFIGKEGLDKIKEKLSPEKQKETKAKVKNYLSSHFGETLTDENKKNLDKAINNLSDEQLESFYEKLKKGDISFKDISEISPEIYSSFLKKEQIDKIKEKAKIEIENIIIKDIKEKYNIDLDSEKKEKLKLLIKENTTFSDETIGNLIEIEKNKRLTTSDIYGPLLEGAINSTALIFGLISNEIVPATAVGLDIAKDGAEVVSISINALGIGDYISIESFNKSIENMTETEKAVFIGLLYRKGGLFLNIIGNISATISRLGIETFTKTEVKSLDLTKNSLSNNYGKQAENFEKIAQKLDPENFKGKKELLERANGNLIKIKENYQIINILSENKTNPSLALEKIKNLNIDIPANLNSKSSIDDIARGFRESRLPSQMSLGESIKGNFGFGKTTDFYRLNSKMENILQAQSRMMEGNFISTGIGKFKELINVGEISRLGDRMTLHFESVDDAKKGISNLNILANKFPDLVKGTLDKLPIIAIAGIAAGSEKPFFEELQKEMFYLFPLIGPIMLIKDSGISWENGEIKGINVTEAGIAGALLTMDTLFLSKELAINGSKGGLKYMVKPISDIYSIGRGTLEGVHNIGKAALNGKSISGVFKESLSKTKGIGNKNLRAIAILAGAAYIGLEYAFSENNLKEIFGEDGTMDKEKLKQEISKLSDENKEVCLKYLIQENIPNLNLETIEVDIENNNINIVSKNKDIQGDWIINESMIDILQLNPNIKFEYKNPA